MLKWTFRGGYDGHEWNASETEKWYYVSQKQRKAIQQVPPGMVLGDDMRRQTEEREEITG